MRKDGTWSLIDAWEWMEESAQVADASVRDTDSWVPAVEEELVAAARVSELSQWHPFMNHNHLRFSDGEPPWMPGGRDDVKSLPGSISFDTRAGWHTCLPGVERGHVRDSEP
ncbi:hypothetical protein [Streptomyces sp. NPDC001843]|uniref:hypothetical protein n=1 Tax=Streptomyces sp. NPDC001843 TaxID=3364617 RepID=UPI0036871D4C